MSAIILLCITGFLLLTNTVASGNTLKNLLNRRFIFGVSFTQCPNGFVRHDESCYFASHEITDWPSAQQYCLGYGGHLAFIETAAEDNFIRNFVKGIYGSATDPGHKYWLGGLDTASEGEWIWALAVKPLTYTNWKPGEPNNNPGHLSQHQDCLSMYADTGLWDDGWCDDKHNFLCEVNLDVEPSIIG